MHLASKYIDPSSQARLVNATIGVVGDVVWAPGSSCSELPLSCPRLM